MKPFLSVIIPIYNVEKYLSRCLDSVYAQSFKSFEVICVNDGSTDNSFGILKEYQVNHPEIVIVNQENKGLGEARNSGVPFATGDYIWFIDSDDWIEPTAFEKLNLFINNVSGAKDLILFDCFRVDEDGNKETLRNFSGFNNAILDDGFYLYQLLNRDALFAAWVKLFKRQKYQKSGFRFEKGFYEDIPLIKYYYSEKCSVAYCNEPLYNYFVRETSIMFTPDIRTLDIFLQFEVITRAFSMDIKYSADIPSFFYRLMLFHYKRFKGLGGSEIQAKFKELYRKYQKEYGYFSKGCFFNSKISWKSKIKIAKDLMLPHYLNKL